MAQSARRHMIENVSEIMAMGMVGATRIELVTPTMSTCGVLSKTAEFLALSGISMVNGRRTSGNELRT
jgi:hypothetical protein